MPGEIADRPGISDRGVTSPAIGIVTQVHAFPGDTVRPGEKLFTLRLLSEYVQNAQAELFKATRETELEQEKRARLAQIGEGAIAGARLIEIDQQLRRLPAAITSHRQELLARGLSPEQIAEVAAGRFVSSVEIVAPPSARGRPAAERQAVTYEVQELKVELGTQVQAGQLLAVLSDHRLLYVVGHAFKREAPALERAAQRGLAGRIEFAEDDAAGWPPLPADLRDPASGQHDRSARAAPSTSSCRWKTSRAATPRTASRSWSGGFGRASGCGCTCRSRSSPA